MIAARMRAPRSRGWRPNQIMLYTVNEKGEQVFMDDADRRKRAR